MRFDENTSNLDGQNRSCNGSVGVMRSNAFNFLSMSEFLPASELIHYSSSPSNSFDIRFSPKRWVTSNENKKKCSGTEKQETFLSEMKNRLETWSHLRTSIWIYLHTFSWHYGHSWWTGGERTGGACLCLVTRHDGPELIKTVWFETLPCSAVKVSCKNTENSQPISLRLLAQERRRLSDRNISLPTVTAHVTCVSAPGRFPFAPTFSLSGTRKWWWM